MTVNRRKKNSRQKGGHTYGWGSMKKHRGAGNRGGSGLAGTGKRADSIKPSIWENPKFFGRHGFTSLRLAVSSVNISQLEEHLEQYLEEKLISQDKGAYIIKLQDLGFDKLLGTKATKKLLITAASASKKALEAVKKAGGEVTLNQ